MNYMPLMGAIEIKDLGPFQTPSLTTRLAKKTGNLSERLVKYLSEGLNRLRFSDLFVVKLYYFLCWNSA